MHTRYKGEILLHRLQIQEARVGRIAQDVKCDVPEESYGIGDMARVMIVCER